MLKAPAELESAEVFAPYQSARVLLVAVSGGPDSLAMLWLAAQWANGKQRPRIEAATVDHGMRQEGRAEALMVARVAHELGVAHHTLEWQGAKPATRLQERAREARYSLLDACARRIGADALLTAHHADDQAETILFRLLRGSGIAGLAGMAPQSWRGDILHGRPLLGFRKVDLVALCEREGLACVRDPSNDDPRFARTGLRRLTGLLAAEGLGPAQLQRLAGRAQRMEAAVDFFMRRSLAEGGAGEIDGAFKVDLDAFRDAPEEILLRFLTGGIARLAGGGAKLRLDRAEDLAGRLAQTLELRQSLQATLGGALVKLEASGMLTLRLERPRRNAKVHDISNFPDLMCESPSPSLGKTGLRS